MYIAGYITPLRGGPHVKPQVHSKELNFFTYLNMLNILITWNLNFNIISPRELTHTDKNPNKLKNAHFSPHLCPKLIFNITYLKKTKPRHWAWPMPHFYTQVTWVWHIPKYMILSSIIQSLFWLNKCNTQKERKLCDTAEIHPFDLLLCLLSEIHLKSNSIEVMYSIVDSKQK